MLIPLQVLSKATPLMKNIIMSNKWEVISYLSGVSTSGFYTETPEWYAAVHSLLSQFPQSGDDEADSEQIKANAKITSSQLPIELSYLC